MPNATNIAIIAGARTPMGRYCGKLRDFTAMELAAIASQEAIRRAGVDANEFDHAVFGNAQQTSGDSLYGARHVALKAGLPVEVPALTVNRLCGSGMQAIVSGAQMIQLGEARTVLAGGMESMSQAPHVIHGLRWGLGQGEAGVWKRWQRHRRQRQWDCGWWRRGGAHLFGSCPGARSQAHGTDCELGHRRRRPQDHGLRPGAEYARRAEKSRHEAGRN